MASPRMEPAERIRRHVVIDERGCWVWQSTRLRNGYGRINEYVRGVGSTSRLAHRYAYEHLVGPIPEGLHLDHLCRVRHCVNPAHLEPVTCRENVLRSPDTVAGRNARKTRCPRGHLYDAVRSRGDRYCRRCAA